MAPLPPPRDDGVNLYNVKRVSFFGRQDVPVICQNENGPCPLIGIANVLLLRGVLSLDAGGGADRVMVSTEELMSLLAARLLDVNQKPNASDDNQIVQTNQEQNLNDALAVLPSLATGLDVNVRFRHPLDFEFTAELAVFDLLDITLCHAWVVDSAQKETRDAIGARSYNQLMERLVELATAFPDGDTLPQKKNPEPDSAGIEPPLRMPSDPEDAALRAALALSLQSVPAVVDGDTTSEPASPSSCAVAAILDEAVRLIESECNDDADVASTSTCGTGGTDSTPTRKQNRTKDKDSNATSTSTERLVIESFLRTSASQLTPNGLRDARDAIKERELAVFFRNNHFATVFKLRGVLFLLATDFGYLREKDVVWEVLCDAKEGGGQQLGRMEPGSFVNSRFEPFEAHVSESESRRNETEDDARLAAALLLSAADVPGDGGNDGRDGSSAQHGQSQVSAPGTSAALLQTFLRAPAPNAEDADETPSADADHALAVALQAEYEEERALEDAARERRRAEASAATRQPQPQRQPTPQPPPPRAASASSRQPPRSKKASYGGDCVVM